MSNPQTLHISFSAIGGAGVVAKELSSSLNTLGRNSEFRSLTDGDIRSVLLSNPKLFAESVIDYYLVRSDQANSLFSLYRRGSVRPLKQLLTGTNSLLHLHWTPGVVNTSGFEFLNDTNRNIVWTLHDMYPFTGGCHHAIKCERFHKECTQCPQVRSVFQRAVSRSQEAKRKSFGKLQKMALVAPSMWLKNKAEMSNILEGRDIRVIPNPVDTDLFSPMHQFRQKIRNHFVIGCSATNLDDPMKGISVICEAIKSVQQSMPHLSLELLAIGGGTFRNVDIMVRRPGLIQNKNDLASNLKEIDLFVSMSKAESFGLSVAEALSSGVPVICLNSGAIPELITHGANGFIVESLPGLIHFMTYFFENIGEFQKFSEAARASTVNSLKNTVVAQQYLDLYQEIESL